MTQKSIYFDLDKTLINSSSLYLDFWLPALVDELGMPSEADLEEIKNASYSRPDKAVGFQPDVFAKLVAKRFKLSYDQVLEILYREIFYKKCIYDDVIPTLEKLKGKFRLGVFSEGKNWQKEKLYISGLDRFFEDKMMLFFEDKMKPEVLDLIAPESIVIDDKQEVVEKLAQNDHFKTIWLNRLDQSTMDQVTTIHSLSELPSLL